jgi:hypothetical protein
VINLRNPENSDMNIGIAAPISIFTILILCLASLASDSHAQTSTSSDDAQKTTTSGGTLDVKLEQPPNPIKSRQETSFKLTFLQKDTDTVQVHIDYNFIILKDNVTEVFRASQETGQALLQYNETMSTIVQHTAEGIVTIPFRIEEPGIYNIRVPVKGINFIPIATEYADFSVKVQ